ncbi:MAG TPA: hypothetical protein VM711_10920 [Sphingomicrobium sp.]|nr:hypothetical protein [Sphingomicrobium sp.]
MAFHQNLINALWGYLPAAGPTSRHHAPEAKPRLQVHWELGPDGRPQSHWELTSQ